MHGTPAFLLVTVTLALALAGCASDPDSSPGREDAGGDAGTTGPGATAPTDAGAAGAPFDRLGETVEVPPRLDFAACRSIEIASQVPAAIVEPPEGMQYVTADPQGLFYAERGLSIECDQAVGAEGSAFVHMSYFLLVTPADSPFPDAQHGHLTQVASNMESALAFMEAYGTLVSPMEGFIRAAGSALGSAADLEAQTEFPGTRRPGTMRSLGTQDAEGRDARQLVWVVGPEPYWQPGLGGVPPEAAEWSYLLAERAAATDAAAGFALVSTESALVPLAYVPRHPSFNAVGFDLAVTPLTPLPADDV